jgi:hypothetical protein
MRAEKGGVSFDKLLGATRGDQLNHDDKVG